MEQDENNESSSSLPKSISPDIVVDLTLALPISDTSADLIASDATAAIDNVQKFSCNLPLLSKKRLVASADVGRSDKRSSDEAIASFSPIKCKRSTVDATRTSAIIATIKCEDDSESLSDEKGKSSFSSRLETHDEVVARESSHQFIPSTPTSPTRSSLIEPDSERSINDLEELILSQIFSSSESTEEIKSVSSTTSNEIVPYSPLSPKLDLSWNNSSNPKKELAELDLKIVDWVTKTDPIIEQWEIYFLIQEHTGYPYHSLSVMQRLNEIYLGRTNASVLLRNCQTYDRARRIKNRLTTLDKMPEVEDAHFSVDMVNICNEQCLVSQDADRVLAWIKPIRGVPTSHFFKTLP
ncbi:hypothetical protein OnM2_047086 [Erysiphe neolycopersici]|uniref:Uncharacterized protein n=1 Tax=Erysiphe neolycopersici TaxID=212602 RepID=A0A420HTM5_9PEZI|nr:hypothetical protein OnM2_047086 [Erysiphe neolycopersici]